MPNHRHTASHLRPSNDRTIIRTASYPCAPHPAPYGALKNWLTRQTHMLESWQDELIAHNAEPETVKLISEHKDWLSQAIARLS